MEIGSNSVYIETMVGDRDSNLTGTRDIQYLRQLEGFLDMGLPRNRDLHELLVVGQLLNAVVTPKDNPDKVFYISITGPLVSTEEDNIHRILLGEGVI